jgi:hypothetical protein
MHRFDEILMYVIQYEINSAASTINIGKLGSGLYLYRVRNGKRIIGYGKIIKN